MNRVVLSGREVFKCVGEEPKKNKIFGSCGFNSSLPSRSKSGTRLMFRPSFDTAPLVPPPDQHSDTNPQRERLASVTIANLIL